MTRVGRGGIPVPIDAPTNPGPRFTQGAAGSGGAGRGRVTAQRTPPPGSPSIIQDANAATRQKPPVAPPTVAPAAASPGGEGQIVPHWHPNVRETKNVYGNTAGINRYTDASGVPTFTNKGRVGYDEMQGAGGGLSIVPGVANLIAGGGGPTEQIDTPNAGTGSFQQSSFDQLSAARQAAADRGDFEAVERSYLTTPEQKAEYAAGKAEKSILKRLPRLPGKELTQALAGLTDLRTAKEGKRLSLDQIKAARAAQLLNGQPAGSGAADKLLFGDRSSTNKPQTFKRAGPPGPDGLPGAEELWEKNEAGQWMQVDLTGGQNAQAGGMPADYPDAYQGLKPDGTPGWFVKRDGKTYLVSQ